MKFKIKETNQEIKKPFLAKVLKLFLYEIHKCELLKMALTESLCFFSLLLPERF